MSNRRCSSRNACTSVTEAVNTLNDSRGHSMPQKRRKLITSVTGRGLFHLAGTSSKSPRRVHVRLQCGPLRVARPETEK